MISNDEFYFVALCMMDENDEEVVFPVRFQTRDYKTAVLFTSMLTDRDPEKRIFVCNDVGDIYKVSDKKRA